MAAIELPKPVKEEIANRLEAATGVTEPRRIRPRDLRSDTVLARLGEIEAFGGTTLEEYALCSYRWLIGHELSPQRLDPADEPLVLGGLAHRALEDLYKERPGGTARPTPRRSLRGGAGPASSWSSRPSPTSRRRTRWFWRRSGGWRASFPRSSPTRRRASECYCPNPS